MHYEEQFSNQLSNLYKNVSGYIYIFDNLPNYIKAKEPQMWATEEIVKPSNVERVENVYDEILKYERLGKVIIHRIR